MLNHKLILPPKEPNSQPEILDCCEPVIIIGANGAGKSRLGLWIEQNQSDPEKVHRISAQKSLDFPEYVQLKSLEQAEKELRLGTIQDPQGWGGPLPTKMINRWAGSQARPKLSVTPPLDDYEKLIAVLFARRSQRNNQVIERIREMEKENKNELPKLPSSPDEILLSIWKDLLPHRKLTIEDGKINASISDDNVYHGREMSDGERVAFYLIAQCLCLQPNSIVIIDEPEIHLHKSLMSKLWSKIEEAQPECLFVYITHDIDFAASRVGAKKIWVKNYDGDNWNWDEVPKDKVLPEPVLLEILGSRKKVLFTESNKGGLDYKIYEAIYPEFLIMPCGGCEKVVESTKAMRRNLALHHVEAFGIVDMDYRDQIQIDSWRRYNIFALRVAELENILCVPEILEIVGASYDLNPSQINTICQKIFNFVINKLDKELHYQVAKRSASEIQFKLNKFNAKKSIEKTSFLKTYEELIASIDANKVYEENLSLYENVINLRDYKQALFLYNNKGLLNIISRFFSLKSKEYKQRIISLLSSERKNDVVSALKIYIPLE
jgi:hypothetical protein